MIPVGILVLAAILFLAATRLSAFYSGSETGFYRISPMRLSIQAQQGDRDAARLQKYLVRPEQFVATTLVGNNIANYLVTVSVGLAVSALLPGSGGTAELILTIAVTPVVFVFGELIPKSLFYRAPSTLLRRGAKWFSASYVAFLPLSYPLIVVSRWIARQGNSDKQPLELVLSRPRLMNVLEAGHREGLLTELQSQLADNVMQVARQPVSLSMAPALQSHGAAESSSRDDLLQLARQTRAARLLLYPDAYPQQWSSYIRVADLMRAGQSPRSVAIKLPRFDANATKLEVLTELVKHYSAYGAVVEENVVIGIVSRRALLAQLHRRGPRAQPGPADV